MKSTLRQRVKRNKGMIITCVLVTLWVLSTINVLYISFVLDSKVLTTFDTVTNIITFTPFAIIGLAAAFG